VISIIQHIQYLILKHDCVVVPGFGAFVSRYVGAAFSAAGDAVTPPTRELSFNSLLTHDDGLLIGSITRREGVSYECARSRVEQEVELMQRRLRHEGVLSLPRVGMLTLTAHGAIDFTPDDEACMAILPYYGLSAVMLSPLEQHIPENVGPTIMDVDTTVEEDSDSEKQPRFRLLRYAASAAILIGACLTFLTPVSAPEGISLASLQPNIETTSELQEPSAFISDPDKYAGRAIVLYTPDPAEATATVYPKKAIGDNLDDNHAVQPDRYYVIVASTTSRKEAKRYVRMHSTPSLPLHILASDGRYRVYAASGNDFNAMSAYRTADPRFAKANPDAWVYTLTSAAANR